MSVQKQGATTPALAVAVKSISSVVAKRNNAIPLAQNRNLKKNTAMAQQEKRTKLCWNCEGVVDRHAENCLYCGVYLHPGQEEEEDDSPPYSPRQKKEEAPSPPYSAEEGTEKVEEVEYSSDYKGSEDVKGMILPLLFLLVGATFLVFSMMLYFFSKDGYLVMKWNASYWFIYLIFSLPLLYIGWRTLLYFDEHA